MVNEQSALNSQGRIFTITVSGLGGGYGPFAQNPRCEPPLISIFGGSEPPAPTCTAVWPPVPEPMSTLVNLYPGELEAVTTMPYCIVSRSMSLPVPYPQRIFCDMSDESVRSMPVNRVNTITSLIARPSTWPATRAVPLACTQASIGLGTGTFSTTSQITEIFRLWSMTWSRAWSMLMSL